MRERFAREVRVVLPDEVWHHVKTVCRTNDELLEFIQESLRCYTRCSTRAAVEVSSSMWRADPGRCRRYRADEWEAVLKARLH
jgi:hypothetical protein